MKLIDLLFRTCFGVLLSSSVVITSAHCFKKYNTSTEEVETYLSENDFISIYVGLEHKNDIGAQEETSRNERVQKAQATAQESFYEYKNIAFSFLIFLSIFPSIVDLLMNRKLRT